MPRIPMTSAGRKFKLEGRKKVRPIASKLGKPPLPPVPVTKLSNSMIGQGEIQIWKPANDVKPTNQEIS